MSFGHATSGRCPINLLVANLWSPSRKHGGLFVLNLSPLSKSMLPINFDFYDALERQKTQLKILYTRFYITARILWKLYREGRCRGSARRKSTWQPILCKGVLNVRSGSYTWYLYFSTKRSVLFLVLGHIYFKRKQ